MSTSIRSAIGEALRDRLATITAANGYPVEFRNVWYDRIPVGLELTPTELPAAFLLDDGASYDHLHGVLEVRRRFRVQVVTVDEATDDDVNLLIRVVSKALWANSATAQVQDAFRFHPAVYQVSMESDETDLHMIEANRIAALSVVVHYRTRPYDL